ncbi:MAG TPA: M28 family metallopeptidase [Bryobacteraceae bacterium]|nr:M28 family metallopeptidase [Bryobacteraceae bacterium]
MKRHLLIALWAAFSLPGEPKLPEAKRWWSHVLYLADDKLEGRETGSEGHRRAAAYVAGEFERSGLKPAGDSGYMQTVRLRSRWIVETQSSVVLVRNGRREPLTLGEDCIVSMRTEAPEQLSAPLVFVGYGLVVPEMKYDDLAGLDLRGKIAVYIAGGPESISGSLRSHYQSTAERAKTWQRAGAVGSVAIASPRSSDLPWHRTSGARLQPAMNLADKAAPERLSIIANTAHADKFLAGSGHTVQELFALSRSGKRLPKFPIPAVLEARVRLDHKELESQNVAGILPGTDPKLKNEYVVLSAHLDHLGRGKPVNGDAVYNGAMDNASGIATLIETAAALRGSGAKLHRSVLFVAVTGEEKGLLGSQYFSTHPTVKKSDIVANLNMDMFLPLFPLRILTAIGAQESDLGDRARAVAGPLGIAVENDPEPQRNRFIRSDQYNFILQGVPALALKVGYRKRSPEEGIARKWLEQRYHAPSDDVNQPVDFKAAADFNHVMALLTEAIANQTDRPKWKDSSFFRRFAQ